MNFAFYFAFIVVLRSQDFSEVTANATSNDEGNDVIKENDDSPKGWKIFSQPPNEAHMQVKTDAANKWTTEWTTRSIGNGKSLGAVPDFLQELQNEYHGPDFDYFATFDNSNENADESQYHYKTPFDAHDFLSHHQQPNSIELSDQHGWQVPPNKLLELEKDEAELNNLRKKLVDLQDNTKKKPLEIAWDKAPENPPTKGPEKPGRTDAKSEELDTRITNIMKTNETKPSQIHTPQSTKTKTSVKDKLREKDNSKKTEKDENITKNPKENANGQVNIPLGRIIKKLVSGVQSMLQLREGSPDPFKGSWALSYKVNNTKKDQQDDITYHEANDMLLKFNNSEDNQEDWSLIYHKGRTDISSENKSEGKSNINMLDNSRSHAKLNVAKIKRDNLGKGKKNARTKKTLIPTDKGWSLFKLNGTAVQKTKNSIALKTTPGQKKLTETLLPTDGGWSLFKANNTSSTSAKGIKTKLMLPTDKGWSVFNQEQNKTPANVTKTKPNSPQKDNLKPDIKVIKKGNENGWIVLKVNKRNKSGGGVILTPSDDGWVESPASGDGFKAEIIRRKFVNTFQPAKVVTVSNTTGNPQINTQLKPDVNKKLLKNSNEDSENMNMLEDEKDELERELEKGHAVDASKKGTNVNNKVTSLTRKVKNDSAQMNAGEPKVEKVMDTIRKAGLDSPKITKRIRPPKSHGQKDVDDLHDRGDDTKKVIAAEEAENEKNKTENEEKLQTSLHESLQSAMSGIVNVFNNRVEGHSIMAAKGSLKPNEDAAGAEELQNKLSKEDFEVSNITWTPWSEWGSCSVSCGRGWISRRRFCLTVTRKCEGRAIEMKFCHSRPCPEEIIKTTEEVGALLNPQGEWAPWSPCSVTCGEGWTVRRKVCYGRHLDKCSGRMLDIKRCRKHRRCISPLRKKLKNVKVKPVGKQVTWSAWSECSTTCGRGWQTRTRECNITNLNKCASGRYDIRKCIVGKSCKRPVGKTLKHHYRHRNLYSNFRGNRESGKDKKIPTSSAATEKSRSGGTWRTKGMRIQNTAGLSPEIKSAVKDIMLTQKSIETGQKTKKQKPRLPSKTTGKKRPVTEREHTNTAKPSQKTKPTKAKKQKQPKKGESKTKTVAKESNSPRTTKNRKEKLHRLHQAADKKKTKKPATLKGWGKWSEWTDCSKTCGTGIQSRFRTCIARRRHKRSKSSGKCVGDKFETQICATDPCDPFDNDGIQVPEGYQTKMKCPFKPNSKVAKVYWITPQGDSISEDTLDMRYLVKGSVLYIKHAEKEDVGIYHCLAATEDGRVIETLAARLVVQTCEDNFCQNGGQCFQLPPDENTSYERVVCKCTDGFTGRFCTHNPNGTTDSTVPPHVVVRDRKLLILLVVVIFSLVVALCWLMLVICRKTQTKNKSQTRDSIPPTAPPPPPLPPDNKPPRWKKQVFPVSKSKQKDSEYVQMGPVYEEIGPPSPRSQGSTAAPSSWKPPDGSHNKKEKKKRKTVLGEVLETAEDGKQAFKKTFDLRGNKIPPSKAEVEAAEKADRASLRQSRDVGEGMSRRSLPPLPTSGRATPNEYHADPAPNVSSGYLHPANQSAQLPTSVANAEYHVSPTQHPVGFNTDTQRGVNEQGTYEVPRNMYRNTGIPQSAQDNVTPVHEKSQISNTMYTSTPVSSPSQGSFGFQTSPLPMRSSGTEKKQLGQWKTEQYASRGNIKEGLTGMEAPDTHSPSGVISNQRFFPTQQSFGRLYPTDLNPLSHGGRVSPPIRSRIAELEVAMGISPNQTPGSVSHIFPKASVQSFEDSFTGLREPRPVQNYNTAASPSQSKLLMAPNGRSPVLTTTPQGTAMKSNVSTQSFGDSFTGLRETTGTPRNSRGMGGGTSHDSLGDSFTGLRKTSVTPNYARDMGGATSNDSLGDSFTGLGLRSNKNSNAQNHDDNPFKTEILKTNRITPPVPPKPKIKRIPTPIPEETSTTPIDKVATGIVKKAMEDSIAKNIVHSTMEESLAQNIVNKTVKDSVDRTHLNAKETVTNVENKHEYEVDSVQRDDSERSENEPVDTSAGDTNENPSLLDDESEYRSESNKSNSSDYDEEDEQESDVIVMTSGGEDETVDKLVEDVLGRTIDNLAVDEVIDDIIHVTSNEAPAAGNETLDHMLDEVVKKSSHETIEIHKVPSNTSSEEEVNV